MTSSNQHAPARHHKFCYLLFTLLLIGTIPISSAQTSFDVLLGYSPGQNINAQEIPVHMGYGSSRSAITPIRQSAGYTVGLGVRHTVAPGFFIGAELQYFYYKVDYALRENASRNDGFLPMDLNEINHVMSLPISVGVDLGIVKITSGVNVNTVVNSTTTLSSLEGMEDNSRPFYAGWHSGVGVDLKKFGIEMRYNQDFRNYGQGYSIGKKELTFYGNPLRWTFLFKYHLSN
jgi:Outer membrane protein beta-barrel domain